MRILFVGDSITHGNDWASQINFAEVENIAIPGFTTDDVEIQLDEISMHKPDAISLLIGTNDFGNILLNRSGEDVGKRVISIISAIKSELPKSKLVVNSILPRSLEFSERIHQANAVIESFNSVEFQYLNCWPALSENNFLNPIFLLQDGFDVHLSPLGYQAWSEVLIPALKN